ncbi:hypothetical protein A2Z00_00575 [Candidatus Gottesmanbacteria bacterium RBG_13_45_10]|uniref:Uncharacterized protein n=1 Tax=Candidatus Gottesmanbacteria bacterium RBG_13_45_10 TaxID=1798370 RepID=A0A1F5ZFY5_9BACT|nr:MAG: hypothetical protein A2Z00_00575 [Candidatus Gottesmanbacteria bacterium RBG_13_45_10]
MVDHESEGGIISNQDTAATVELVDDVGLMQKFEIPALIEVDVCHTNHGLVVTEKTTLRIPSEKDQSGTNPT